MRIWLAHIGETFPLDGTSRAWRYGMLARELARRGHQVLRWAPTFCHARKTQRFDRDTVVELEPNYRAQFVYAAGYQHHRGLEGSGFIGLRPSGCTNCCRRIRGPR